MQELNFKSFASYGYLLEPGGVRNDNRRQSLTIHSFHSFIYSLPTQQNCVLPVSKGSGDYKNLTKPA